MRKPPRIGTLAQAWRQQTRELHAMTVLDPLALADLAPAEVDALRAEAARLAQVLAGWQSTRPQAHQQNATKHQ